MILYWDPWTAFWSAIAAWMSLGAALVVGFWAALLFWPLLLIAAAVTLWALSMLPGWLAQARDFHNRRSAPATPPRVTIIPPGAADSAGAGAHTADASAAFSLRNATLRGLAFVGVFTILIATWFGLATALGVGAILALILALFPVAPFADRAARWLTRRLSA